MHYLLTFMAQIAGAACVGYIYLADRWLTVGWGLYPTLAGALALSLIILPYGLAWWVNARCQWALMDQDELIAEYQEQYGLCSFDQSEHDKLVIAKDWLRLHPVKD